MLNSVDIWNNNIGGRAMSDEESEIGEKLPVPPPPGLNIPPPPELPIPPPPPLSNDTGLNDEGTKDFQSMWEKKKSEDPAFDDSNRDQMYGHIDRIATGDVGTLLDRFSDRFGSELDREIIVLRKKQQQELRDIKPTVELISPPTIEIEPEDYEEPEEIDSESNEEYDEEDIFVDFFNVVNTLLGNQSDDFINSFIATENFSLFEKVGESPVDCDEDTRRDFFLMINQVLGDMPEANINEFVTSPGFKLFEAAAEIYG
tara:strand:+ start:59788 stop:60561 length:774 start_codon:yes stop_codon:yes gene_type:complete